jgi:hypothetical protein
MRVYSNLLGPLAPCRTSIEWRRRRLSHDRHTGSVLRTGPPSKPSCRSGVFSAADIEKVEMRPIEDPGVPLEGRHGLVDITVTLRSGRAESWSQLREANG